jgi:hypothetical protein
MFCLTSYAGVWGFVALRVVRFGMVVMVLA